MAADVVAVRLLVVVGFHLCAEYLEASWASRSCVGSRASVHHKDNVSFAMNQEVIIAGKVLHVDSMADCVASCTWGMQKHNRSNSQ